MTDANFREGACVYVNQNDNKQLVFAITMCSRERINNDSSRTPTFVATTKIRSVYLIKVSYKGGVT